MPGPAEDPSGTEGEQDRPGLHVAVDREGPVLIVTVAGELDHDTADGLRSALARPLEAGIERIVVDLAELRFCDSTGLNLLLRAHIEGEKTGVRLELAGLRPIVARLFAITGADSVLRIHPDVGSALRAAGPPEGPGAAPSTERREGE
ncbi:STAS domain-containing protein [Streptomyces sp. CBMA123]|uniref:STAS domain-containing protein n=1 Tax=Streptomyces sp. CBMA123 TaxID=1896313 RepID=UPI0016619AD1|nr:STAS domain-containing protein [Streptomyces sp. CBMA123]MBD0690977.1 hypothetical protein [Streptomyces sp. CBMA123]